MLDLGATQLAMMVINDFFRNFFQHFTFHSTHNERHYFVVQFLKSSALIVRKQKLVLFEGCKVNLK